jgi:hypothetical protein
MGASASTTLLLDLDDVLGNLHFARRTGDLGRLALLTYCEVRRWARLAHEESLARHASELVTMQPYPSRDEFLARVDEVIDEMEHIRTGPPPREATLGR